MLPANAATLHEAWALAGLLRARFGDDALPQAMAEARNLGARHESMPIWQAVIECLSYHPSMAVH